MITIALIFIVILFLSVIFLMIVLIEVIEIKDKYKHDVEHLNELNNGLCKENLDLMDKLLKREQ